MTKDIYADPIRAGRFHDEDPTAAVAEGPWSYPCANALQGLSQSSPSRISQIDQAQAQCIWRSIADFDDRDNGRATEYPRLGWRACSPSNVGACEDEPETVVSLPCRFAGSFAGTTPL